MFELATKHNSLSPENCQSSVHPVRQGAPGQTVYAALANNLRSSCNTQKFRLKYACPQTGLNDGERKFTAGTNKNECQLKGVSTHTHKHTAGTHTRQARTLAIRRKREGFNEICTFPHLITKYVKQNHLVFAVNSRVCVCRCACVCVVARRHENKHMFTCKLHNNNAATPTPNKTQIIRCILLGCKSKLYGDFFSYSYFRRKTGSRHSHTTTLQTTCRFPFLFLAPPLFPLHTFKAGFFIWIFSS